MIIKEHLQDPNFNHMVSEQYMIVSVAVLELPFGRLILHLLTCMSLVFLNNFIICIIIADEALLRAFLMHEFVDYCRCNS